MAERKKKTLYVRGIVIAHAKWLVKEAAKAKVEVGDLLNDILNRERKQSAGNKQ